MATRAVMSSPLSRNSFIAASTSSTTFAGSAFPLMVPAVAFVLPWAHAVLQFEVLHHKVVSHYAALR